MGYFESLQYCRMVELKLNKGNVLILTGKRSETLTATHVLLQLIPFTDRTERWAFAHPCETMHFIVVITVICSRVSCQFSVKFRNFVSFLELSRKCFLDNLEFFHLCRIQISHMWWNYLVFPFTFLEKVELFTCLPVLEIFDTFNTEPCGAGLATTPGLRRGLKYIQIFDEKSLLQMLGRLIQRISFTSKGRPWIYWALPAVRSRQCILFKSYRTGWLIATWTDVVTDWSNATGLDEVGKVAGKRKTFEALSAQRSFLQGKNTEQHLWTFGWVYMESVTSSLPIRAGCEWAFWLVILSMGRGTIVEGLISDKFWWMKV